MIKVKIHNPVFDRNEPTFRPFRLMEKHLENYQIKITNSDDYDFLFVGMADFINKKAPLKQSVEQGLEWLENITEGGDYFLFDGSDSTSLMGAYEVFEQSNAIYLFKNQKLKNRKDYKKPYAHNKWFWGNGSDLDLGYDIPEEKWKRIKLSGWNLGYMLPDFLNFAPLNKKKGNDICAIVKSGITENSDHGSRNDIFYNEHRDGVIKLLEELKKRAKVVNESLPYHEYAKTMWDSKMALSPYGMGELCFRDFECIKFGTLMIKPEMDMVDTFPNIWVPGETYIPVKYDWSDLERNIAVVMRNYDNLAPRMIEQSRRLFVESYTPKSLCMYWYNIFSNLSTVKKLTEDDVNVK